MINKTRNGIQKAFTPKPVARQTQGTGDRHDGYAVAGVRANVLGAPQIDTTVLSGHNPAYGDAGPAARAPVPLTPQVFFSKAYGDAGPARQKPPSPYGDAGPATFGVPGLAYGDAGPATGKGRLAYGDAGPATGDGLAYGDAGPAQPPVKSSGDLFAQLFGARSVKPSYPATAPPAKADPVGSRPLRWIVAPRDEQAHQALASMGLTCASWRAIRNQGYLARYRVQNYLTSGHRDRWNDGSLVTEAPTSPQIEQWMAAIDYVCPAPGGLVAPSGALDEATMAKVAPMLWLGGGIVIGALLVRMLGNGPTSHAQASHGHRPRRNPSPYKITRAGEHTLQTVRGTDDEYEVRVYKNGKLRESATYFTNDKVDALATHEAMHKHYARRAAAKR